MKYMVAELMFTVEKAWYENEIIYIILSNKKEILFPVYLNEKLRNAKHSQVGNIEIICGGSGLHWPDLDEDLSIAGIIEGRFQSNHND